VQAGGLPHVCWYAYALIGRVWPTTGESKAHYG